MPQPIQNPRVSTALARAFGLVGRVRPALDEVIVPTVSIGDLSQGEAPPVRRSVSCTALQGAVPAEFTTLRMEVPGNVKAQINSIHVRPGTSGRVNFQFLAPGAPLANSAQSSYSDGVLLEDGDFPAGVATFGTRAAAVANPVAAYWASNGVGLELRPSHWVLGSGRADQYGFMEIQLASPNVDCLFSLTWTEYQLT